jgi:hypothetical protein
MAEALASGSSEEETRMRSRSFSMPVGPITCGGKEAGKEMLEHAGGADHLWGERAGKTEE